MSLFSALGTGLGAVAGSIIPGVGTALGATVGGALGSGAGALLGSSKKKRRNSTGDPMGRYGDGLDPSGVLGRLQGEIGADPYQSSSYTSGMGLLTDALEVAAERDEGRAAARGLSGSLLGIGAASMRGSALTNGQRSLVREATDRQDQQTGTLLNAILTLRGQEEQRSQFGQRRSDQQDANRNQLLGSLGSSLISAAPDIINLF